MTLLLSTFMFLFAQTPDPTPLVSTPAPTAEAITVDSKDKI